MWVSVCEWLAGVKEMTGNSKSSRVSTAPISASLQTCGEHSGRCQKLLQRASAVAACISAHTRARMSTSEYIHLQIGCRLSPMSTIYTLKSARKGGP